MDVKANRCAREVVKGIEREWHKWNLIKGGACSERSTGTVRTVCCSRHERGYRIKPITGKRPRLTVLL